MSPETAAVAAANGLTPEQARHALDSLKQMVHRYIDPTAQVHPTAKVWHYAVILSQAVIGEGCNIGSHVEVGRGSVIGARTRIGSGTFLPPNTLIGEDTFIGPHVAMSDDKFPALNGSDYLAQPPVIGSHVSIGLGAVILPNVRIGDGAVVAAGTVVTKDVPAGCLIRGEPGRIRVPDDISPEAREWMHELIGVQLARCTA